MVGVVAAHDANAHQRQAGLRAGGLEEAVALLAFGQVVGLVVELDGGGDEARPALDQHEVELLLADAAAPGVPVGLAATQECSDADLHHHDEAVGDGGLQDAVEPELAGRAEQALTVVGGVAGVVARHAASRSDAVSCALPNGRTMRRRSRRQAVATGGTPAVLRSRLIARTRLRSWRRTGA